MLKVCWKFFIAEMSLRMTFVINWFLLIPPSDPSKSIKLHNSSSRLINNFIKVYCKQSVDVSPRTQATKGNNHWQRIKVFTIYRLCVHLLFEWKRERQLTRIMNEINSLFAGNVQNRRLLNLHQSNYFIELNCFPTN